MSSDMPDWLAGLVSAPEDEDDDLPLTATMRPQASAVQSQAAAPQPQAPARPQMGVQANAQVGVFEDEDLMADLRSQVAEEEITPPPSAKRTRSRNVFGLLPWQVFFLSLLMFLDVAVIGMLFLVMLGRVVIPF